MKAATLPMPKAKEPRLDNSDPLVTVEQAADFLCLAKTTVYQLIDRGVIKSVGLPGIGTRRIVRIRRSALLAYVASGSR